MGVKEAAEKAAKYIKKKKTKSKPTEESSKEESKAKGSRTASPLPANFNPEANLSNMSKEQADKHQEEMLTWQDRWHQNKKVQNGQTVSNHEQSQGRDQDQAESHFRRRRSFSWRWRRRGRRQE